MLFIDVPKSSIADCNLEYSVVTSCRLCIEKKEDRRGEGTKDSSDKDVGKQTIDRSIPMQLTIG